MHPGRRACARLPRRRAPRGLAITTSVVETLAGLVAINSVNSSLEGGPGEAELAHHVADLARAAGADVEMYDVEPGRPNLLAWIRRGARPTLMFECHLDTVGLDPMPDALNPRVANGRLYGRGSADPKGCLAAMLHVLHAAAADPNFPVDLCLAGAVGEEIVMIGSKVMAERRPPVDAAVVGEPTELQIITAQKGAVRWRVRTHGIAAHSAMPEQGHNAIQDMARALPALARGLEPHLAARPHPVLGNATWNVGTIRGGAGVNVVPDRCEIEIDRRLVPGDTSAEVLDTRGLGVGRAASSATRSCASTAIPRLWTSPRWRRPKTPRLCAPHSGPLPPPAFRLGAAGRRLRHRRGHAFRCRRNPIRRPGPRQHRPGPHERRVDRDRPARTGGGNLPGRLQGLRGNRRLMRLTPRVHLVGSGATGADLSNSYDCHVYLVDGGGPLALIDAGVGLEPELILANVRAAGFDPAAIETIALTHAHADHGGGAGPLHELTGTEVLTPWTLRDLAQTGRRGKPSRSQMPGPAAPIHRTIGWFPAHQRPQLQPATRSRSATPG